MTKQTNFPVTAADAAKPGHRGTTRLSGVSAFATRPELAAEAIRGQRERLLRHRRTCTVVQNETLVSQYFGGFPSRDMTRIADCRMPADGSL